MQQSRVDPSWSRRFILFKCANGPFDSLICNYLIEFLRSTSAPFNFLDINTTFTFKINILFWKWIQYSLLGHNSGSRHARAGRHLQRQLLRHLGAPRLPRGKRGHARGGRRGRRGGGSTVNATATFAHNRARGAHISNMIEVELVCDRFNSYERVNWCEKMWNFFFGTYSEWLNVNSEM